MYQARAITSLDLPELQPYQTMRRQHEHRENGIFVAEGEKIVRRLLKSKYEVVSVVLPEHWLVELEPLLRARPEMVQVFVAEKKFLEAMTGFSMYQGLLAVGKVPRKLMLDDLISRTTGPRLLVAADALSSADNLGAVVRNCAAFAVDALLVGETSTSPYLRRAVRSSMGTVFQIPVIETENLVTDLQSLRRHGIRIIAAHAHAAGSTLSHAHFNRDCCIVFGSEGHGITPAVLVECDETVTIPMPATIDSLNVASAAAAFLYEARRQRGQM